jgi:cyanophycinase-like exopeptidase
MICLQGGAEFGSRCVDMDSELLDRSPAGDVVVLAGAAASGHEYRIAGANAVRYYSRLTDRRVTAVQDPRTDPAAFARAARSAALIVLPGGSPRRLLDVLVGDVLDAMIGVLAEGGTISGASAGAMVLCTYTAIPGAGVSDGLGLVPGVAIPHFDGSNWWNLDLPEDIPRWGLPECGGLVFRSGSVSGIGAPGAQRLERGEATAVEHSPL